MMTQSTNAIAGSTARIASDFSHLPFLVMTRPATKRKTLRTMQTQKVASRVGASVIVVTALPFTFFVSVVASTMNAWSARISAGTRAASAST
jgi:hypothetical protein